MDRRPANSGPLVHRDALSRALFSLEPGPALRRETVAILKDSLAEARQEAERRLVADGRGTKCAESLSRAQDDIISALFDFARSKVFPAANPTEAERIAVVAVGGYGRGTLAPGSDIDLLFLLPFQQTALSGGVVEF